MPKKIALKLEFELSKGKKKPQVSFIGLGGYGVSFTSHVDLPGTKAGDAFDAFSAAAHEFCRQLKLQGELE